MAGRKLAVIQIDVIGRGADDPEAAETVGDRQWNHAPDQRISGQFLRRGPRDVAGRHIEMEDAGEHELDRTALGADHEIDVFRIAREAVGDLAIDDQHEADRPDAQSEEQHIEERAERPRTQVTPGELKKRHVLSGAGWRGNASWRATFGLRRPSCVAMTSDTPCRSAVPSRRSATEAQD